MAALRISTSVVYSTLRVSTSVLTLKFFGHQLHVCYMYARGNTQTVKLEWPCLSLQLCQPFSASRAIHIINEHTIVWFWLLPRLLHFRLYLFHACISYQDHQPDWWWVTGYPPVRFSSEPPHKGGHDGCWMDELRKKSRTCSCRVEMRSQCSTDSVERDDK